MSLTSYRAAPPRDTGFCLKRRRPYPWPWLSSPGSSPGSGRPVGLAEPWLRRRNCEWVFPDAPAAKPGDDLLFHCLSNSTIGAVWFHGRVRDGIGWVTDAMATKLWGRRIGKIGRASCRERVCQYV